MKIPELKGTIDRRILINFRVDTEVIEKFLPSPFRPRIVDGKALAGICLIRLKYIRPAFLNANFGLSSENAAHRFAVEWNEDGKSMQGVYIHRRDTNSLLNHWTGGRIFPGVHHMAQFDVEESNGHFKINILSSDHTKISIEARESEEFSTSSVFSTLQAASDFYKNGSVGFSPNKNKFDGMELKTLQWQVKALSVERVQSDFFADETIFPIGSVQFDNALLMQNVEHIWKNYDQNIS